MSPDPREARLGRTPGSLPPTEEDLWRAGWELHVKSASSRLGLEPPGPMPSVVEVEEVAASPVETAADVSETHDITWIVEDGAGRPRQGVAWIVTGPGGAQVGEGSTGADGKVEVKDVEYGRHQLVIPDVDDVAFETDRVAWGRPVGLRARTSGIADGTQAVVRVFERHREGDDEVLVEWEASVEADAIVTEWTPAPPADAPWGERLPVVAEVECDGHRLKTVRPLDVCRPARRASWAEDEVDEQGFASIEVEAEGLPDGESLALEVVDVTSVPARVLAELEVSIAGGRAQTTWEATAPDDGDDAWLRPDLELVVRIPSGKGFAVVCSPVLVLRRNRVALLD